MRRSALAIASLAAATAAQAHPVTYPGNLITMVEADRNWRDANAWYTFAPNKAFGVGYMKFRNDSDCRICCATRTSSVRSPPGAGVSETRIVSPIPSWRRIERPAALATIPLAPIPASVRPKCRG